MGDSRNGHNGDDDDDALALKKCEFLNRRKRRVMAASKSGFV